MLASPPTICKTDTAKNFAADTPARLETPSAEISENRWLAYSCDGDVALFECRGWSNVGWLNVGVTSIPDNTAWYFGWNGYRVSFVEDLRHLQRRHPEIVAWVEAVLIEMTEGKGNSEMRACRHDWLTRDRAATVEAIEQKTARLVEIDQQIAALDQPLEPEVAK
jgi:hypothetical protein